MEEQTDGANSVGIRHPNQWQSLFDQQTIKKSHNLLFVLKGREKVSAPSLLVFLAVPELEILLENENCYNENVIILPDIEKNALEESLDVLYKAIYSPALQTLLLPNNDHINTNMLLLNVKAENIKIESEDLEANMDDSFSELSSDVKDYDYFVSSNLSSPIPDPIAVEQSEEFEHPLGPDENVKYNTKLDHIANVIKPAHDQTIRRKTVDKNNLTRSIEEYAEGASNRETRKSTTQVINLYNEVMKVAAIELGKDYISLNDVKLEDLPDSLCRFFMICRKKNGEEFNASSIQTFYQSIARFVTAHYKLDIKMDYRFKKVKDIVKARSNELAKSGGRPGINASKAVNTDHIRLAFDKGTLGRHNPRALISTVHYCLLSGFGCCSAKEIRDITNADILFGPEDESKLPKYLELSERIIKTRYGLKYKKREVEERVYLDNDYPDLCPVRTLMEYLQRKNPDQREQHHPFLISIKPTAEKSPSEEPYWFTSAPMGVHTISKLFPKACEDAGIDVKAEKISATSCRKQLVQARADPLVPVPLLSVMMGQKNSNDTVSFRTTTTNASIAPKPDHSQHQMNIPGPSFPYVQFLPQQLLVYPQQLYQAPCQILQAPAKRLEPPKMERSTFNSYGAALCRG